MKAHTLVRTAVIGFIALAAATSSLRAFCNSSSETYAIFQCGRRAYFAPVPSPFTPSNVTGVFWQLGFGNATVSTGLGTDGTGFASKAFNGNDSGYFPATFLDAAATFPTEGFPAGAVCLGSNNWSNSGVDGCCDNSRPDAPFLYTNFYYPAGGPYYYDNDDDILNPYFGTFQNESGFPGYFSIGSVMDYPTAVLAKLPGDAWFAVAAVTNMDRMNNFDPNDMTTWFGDCNPSVGTNPAACDVRQGEFNFANVTNGTPNAIPSQAGKNNVISWQQPPVPVLDNSAPVDPNDPLGLLVVDLSWPAVTLYHDGSVVPSNNPTMDTRNPIQPSDPNAAPGVGVVDILGTFGLVRYQIQVAAANDVGFSTITQTVTCPGDPACTSATSATMTVDASECVRVRTLFGMPPRTAALGPGTCRLGQCGDIGYGVDGDRLCVGPCFPDPDGEMCNGFDDDCDSLVDEGFNINDPCNGIGECGIGVLECQDLTSARCSTEPGGSAADPNNAGDPNYMGPRPDVCDSLDNDCDSATDEDFVLGGACTGVGQCAFDPNGSPISGSVECSAIDPNATQCSTDAGGTIDQSDPELCDALDNDCDAATDEIFNLGAACDGAGDCGAGVIECDPNGIAAICSTEAGGSADETQPETCNGFDQDCDGATDEDFQVGLPCDGEGTCGAGINECNPFDPNLSSSICSTEPGGSGNQSMIEICDALDNDCDASTDEDFLLGQACMGTGACGAGVTECSSGDPNTTFCSSDPGGSDDQSVPEICFNSFDDDCDGQTDEGGGVELCDGADNDCDSATDEDFVLGGPCMGLGVCGAGTVECDPVDPNAAGFCSTMPGGSQDASSIEICDGLDNNCDAITDDGFSIGIGTNCRTPAPPIAFGVCDQTGATRECSPFDPFATICNTMPGGTFDLSSVEVCGNGTDDDCDNVLDAVEFLVGQACNPPGVCGIGAIECDPNGGPDPLSSLCSTGPGGSDSDPNDPRFDLCAGIQPFLGPLPEICDGLDNDCDSMTDEGSALPCELFDPVELSSVDCTDPRSVQPRIQWYARSFDVFRPQISWDPGFAKKKSIRSYVNLPSTFWEPNGKQWRKACVKARKENPGNPVLYFRVLRTDTNLPKNDPGRQDVTPVISAVPFYAQADLSISKTDKQLVYVPGGTLIYTIVVANAGPSNVIGAAVTDVFPADLTSVTWSCDMAMGGAVCPAPGAGDLNLSLDLPAGSSLRFTVEAGISLSATASIVNTATVSVPGDVLDPDTCNNSATDTDATSVQADLSITKTDGVATYTPGGAVTYTIVVSNAGPSDVTGATVTDTFPAALINVTWTCAVSGGAFCAASGSGDISESVDVPVGDSVTFTVNADILGSATGDLVNSASVAPPGGIIDPDPSDNSATDTDTDASGVPADLSITKTDGVTTYTPGGVVTYTIVVSNAGPSGVTGAMVTDTFPADLINVNWTCAVSGGASCAASGSGDISESVDVPVGGSVTFTVDADILGTATGDLVNTASVAPPGGVSDPNLSDNSATDTDTP